MYVQCTLSIFQNILALVERRSDSKISKMFLRAILWCFHGLYFKIVHLWRDKEMTGKISKMFLRRILSFFKQFRLRGIKTKEVTGKISKIF